ncbi:hypothetical protein SNE40_007937 [Patella caerulea]|uniref:Uncharacterized protein n=1 Tax=Patella caerulea TaxID=87958 RepID=A0AAN8K5M0_PATCE
MLQCQVSNQLSSLSIKDNGSSAYPMYVSTRDLKLGLTTFWRSPYGTGSRKREFPTVTPTKSWNDDTHLLMNNSSAENKVKGILKYGAFVESSSEESDPSRKKFKKTLRRASSFTAPNIYTNQTLKKVQFGEQTHEEVPQSIVVDKSEISASQCSHNPTDVTLVEHKNTPVGEPTSPVSVPNKSVDLPNVTESTGTPRSASVNGVPNGGPQSASPTVSLTTPTHSRIPRLCRSYTTLPLKNTPVNENSSNVQKNLYREPNTKSAGNSRPRTWGGTRSAILPDHTNFCNREKTIRILKWLQDVDDKQTKEGKCTVLMNSVELLIQPDL